MECYLLGRMNVHVPRRGRVAPRGFFVPGSFAWHPLGRHPRLRQIARTFSQRSFVEDIPVHVRHQKNEAKRLAFGCRYALRTTP